MGIICKFAKKLFFGRSRRGIFKACVWGRGQSWARSSRSWGIKTGSIGRTRGWRRWRPGNTRVRSVLTLKKFVSFRVSWWTLNLLQDRFFSNSWGRGLDHRLDWCRRRALVPFTWNIKTLVRVQLKPSEYVEFSQGLTRTWSILGLVRVQLEPGVYWVSVRI